MSCAFAPRSTAGFGFNNLPGDWETGFVFLEAVGTFLIDLKNVIDKRGYAHETVGR